MSIFDKLEEKHTKINNYYFRGKKLGNWFLWFWDPTKKIWETVPYDIKIVQSPATNVYFTRVFELQFEYNSKKKQLICHLSNIFKLCNNTPFYPLFSQSSQTLSYLLNEWEVIKKSFGAQGSSDKIEIVYDCEDIESLEGIINNAICTINNLGHKVMMYNAIEAIEF